MNKDPIPLVNNKLIFTSGFHRCFGRQRFYVSYEKIEKPNKSDQPDRSELKRWCRCGGDH